MQKASKFALGVGSLAMLAGMVSVVPFASAKTTTHTKIKTTVTTHGKSHQSHAKAHKRTLPGTVVSTNGTNSLVMKKGNKTYTITVTESTVVRNRKGTVIPFADIKAGHKISVRGTVTGSEVTNILHLRDITLPVDTTSTAN